MAAGVGADGVPPCPDTADCGQRTGEHPTGVTGLTVRREFLYVAKGRREARPGVVIQARPRPADDPVPRGLARVGFTATKKIGNAVLRNRAKRRLREAARRMVPDNGVAGMDYVMIARAATATRPWCALLDDVKTALLRLRKPVERRPDAATDIPRPRRRKANPAGEGPL